MNMIKNLFQVSIAIVAIIICSCSNSSEDKNFECKNTVFPDTNYTIEGKRNFLTGYKPLFEDGDINAIIEIPAGTSEKWEVDKSNGKIIWEFVDKKPRIVKYLGYPGNYGMIPRTLLSKEFGGDGDPLDVIVLGPPVEKGSIVKCKLIGVLYLLDRGEKDDKLIAISPDSPLYDVNSIVELNDSFNGISEILQLWFTNYKGPGKMESKGFGDKKTALNILKLAIDEYQLKNNTHNKK